MAEHHPTKLPPIEFKFFNEHQVQYTTKKDMHGEKIYDHDILLFDQHYYLVHWDEIRTGYQPFNVFIESELSERMFNFFSTPEFKTEIIANIHSCNYCERLFKKTVDN